MSRLGSAEWVAGVLTKDGDIESYELLDGHCLRLHRADKPPAIIGVLSMPLVAMSDIQKFLGDEEPPSFVVNIPSEAIWEGPAIDALAALPCAFGGMSDLRRALYLTDPADYVFKEFEYVERRFRQTGFTTGLERLYDRVWQINRKAGQPVRVAISNAYDLTADVVRNLHQKCAPFDGIFHTNSLGRVTNEASRAAKELDIDLIGSSGLLDYLRQK